MVNILINKYFQIYLKLAHENFHLNFEENNWNLN